MKSHGCVLCDATYGKSRGCKRPGEQMQQPTDSSHADAHAHADACKPKRVPLTQQYCIMPCCKSSGQPSLLVAPQLEWLWLCTQYMQMYMCRCTMNVRQYMYMCTCKYKSCRPAPRWKQPMRQLLQPITTTSGRMPSPNCLAR